MDKGQLADSIVKDAARKWLGDLAPRDAKKYDESLREVEFGRGEMLQQYLKVKKAIRAFLDIAKETLKNPKLTKREKYIIETESKMWEKKLKDNTPAKFFEGR